MTMQNASRFKCSIVQRPLEYFGTRLLQRSESTCSNSTGKNIFGNNAKIGGKSGAVWERMAVAVKYSEKETSSNTYLNTIRATHDPTLELKTVEDELKGTIGKALGRQGHKIMLAKQLMEKELQRYNDLLKTHSTNGNSMCHVDIITAARNYNEYRKQALQARWELTVQRQAAGFIVNNHNYVTEQYPIATALPVPTENDTCDNAMNNNNNNNNNSNVTGINGDPKVKTFTDQLQWWERVGRWR